MDGHLLLTQYVVVGSSVYETVTQPALVAGREYPRTYREFVKWFPDDARCAAYLQQLRWPNGFECAASTPVTESDVTYGYDW